MSSLKLLPQTRLLRLTLFLYTFEDCDQKNLSGASTAYLQAYHLDIEGATSPHVRVFFIDNGNEIRINWDDITGGVYSFILTHWYSAAVEILSTFIRHSQPSAFLGITKYHQIIWVNNHTRNDLLDLLPVQDFIWCTLWIKIASVKSKQCKYAMLSINSTH